MTQVRDQRGVPLRTLPRAHLTSRANRESWLGRYRRRIAAD